MNALVGTAACATLAGLGAAALLLAPALVGGRSAPSPEPVRAAAVAAEPEAPAALVVEVPEVPPVVVAAEPAARPPSFALDLTFSAAPLRPGFADGSPVYGADLGAARELPAGAGAAALSLHRPDGAAPPPPEEPPLSGGPAPALARLAAAALLVRPPLRPAFADPPDDVPAPAAAGPSFPAAPSPGAAWTESERSFAPALAPAAPAPTVAWPDAFGSSAPHVDPSTDGGPAGRSLQAGVASWYGPGFHGRRTASGERFNQHDLTAAHPRLPFGTRVRVVDERSGRSVVVRINDRGPFKPGRIIDLSRASAQALGMGGLARVKLVSAE